jgi:hypothetical protein
MKIQAICLALFASVLLAAFPSGAEDARLPYAKLYEMQRLQSELSGQYTNLVVALRMESVSTNITATNLDVYIDTKAGRIAVRIGQYGDFNVPMRDDLLAENPWIITNQPRGSMKLDWFLGLVVRHLTTSIRYRDLMQVVRDCGEVRQRMRQILPTAPKGAVAGLRLTFSPPGNGASVVIHSERADKKLEAGATGTITMMIDPALLDEDPLVTLSKEPASVELVTQKEQE